MPIRLRQMQKTRANRRDAHEDVQLLVCIASDRLNVLTKYGSEKTSH